MAEQKAELLSAEEIIAGVGTLDDWAGDTTGITRTARLPTFPAAIAVVDKVALVAEELDHHPDIDIRWTKVTFLCVTYSAKGVTNLDLALARRIDAIVADALA